MGITARQAIVEDVEELARLREAMLTSFGPVLGLAAWPSPGR